MTELDEDALQDIYTWIDDIPLSRPKKNIARDFSDGVLVAEIIQHFLPKFVDRHNYINANSSTQKLDNWNFLSRKCFNKLSYNPSEADIKEIIACKSGAIEVVLGDLRLHIEAYIAKRKAAALMEKNKIHDQLADGQYMNENGEKKIKQYGRYSSVKSEGYSAKSERNSAKSERGSAKSERIRPIPVQKSAITVPDSAVTVPDSSVSIPNSAVSVPDRDISQQNSVITINEEKVDNSSEDVSTEVKDIPTDKIKVDKPINKSKSNQSKVKDKANSKFKNNINCKDDKLKHDSSETKTAVKVYKTSVPKHPKSFSPRNEIKKKEERKTSNKEAMDIAPAEEACYDPLMQDFSDANLTQKEKAHITPKGFGDMEENINASTNEDIPQETSLTTEEVTSNKLQSRYDDAKQEENNSKYMMQSGSIKDQLKTSKHDPPNVIDSGKQAKITDTTTHETDDTNTLDEVKSKAKDKASKENKKNNGKRPKSNFLKEILKQENVTASDSSSVNTDDTPSNVAPGFANADNVVIPSQDVSSSKDVCSNRDDSEGYNTAYGYPAYTDPSYGNMQQQPPHIDIPLNAPNPYQYQSPPHVIQDIRYNQPPQPVQHPQKQELSPKHAVNETKPHRKPVTQANSKLKSKTGTKTKAGMQESSDNQSLKMALEEKEQALLASQETVQILQVKIRRLEHLLHLKDMRINELKGNPITQEQVLMLQQQHQQAQQQQQPTLHQPQPQYAQPPPPQQQQQIPPTQKYQQQQFVPPKYPQQNNAASHHPNPPNNSQRPPAPQHNYASMKLNTHAPLPGIPKSPPMFDQGYQGR